MIAYQPPHSQKVYRSHRNITGCMATVMQEMAGAGEAVTEQALESRGFTPASIKRFSRRAANIARRRFIRHIDRSEPCPAG